MLQTQSRSIAGLNSVEATEKQLPKLFFTSRFSLSEKLHLETGLAFNTTRYSLGSFAAAETIQTCLPLEVWSPRAGLSYRFTKNKTIYASISKGFSTPTVSETLTLGD
jgi:iron complex outermembrane receptor protein